MKSDLEMKANNIIKFEISKYIIYIAAVSYFNKTS